MEAGLNIDQDGDVANQCKNPRSRKRERERDGERMQEAQILQTIDIDPSAQIWNIYIYMAGAEPPYLDDRTTEGEIKRKGKTHLAHKK
jgi:hypothetical protein